jgi:predicted DNA-binding transcriptional regulator AlpA
MEQDTELAITTVPELFTVKEVLDRLKISRQMLWLLTKEKGIQPIKIGSSIRYTQAHIAQLITPRAGH